MAAGIHWDLQPRRLLFHASTECHTPPIHVARVCCPSGGGGDGSATLPREHDSRPFQGR